MSFTEGEVTCIRTVSDIFFREVMVNLDEKGFVRKVLFCPDSGSCRCSLVGVKVEEVPSFDSWWRGGTYGDDVVID